MLARIDTPLQSLRESLAKIRAVADEMDADPLPATATRMVNETLRCSLTVILSGFLESFLRDMCEAYIEVVSLRRVPFTDLPDRLKRQHFVQGGAVLGAKTRRQSRVSWIAADHLDIVRRLASPVASGGDYSLVWEAFVSTKGNPDPEVIEGLLKSLGVDQAGSTLDAALLGAYGPRKLALRAFIDVRNECAHTGTALKVPTTADLRGYCDLVEEVCVALVGVLKQRLGQKPFVTSVNLATPEQLERIPGLGPARVKAIVNLRSTVGYLQGVGDLAQIPGFGPRTIELCREHGVV